MKAKGTGRGGCNPAQMAEQSEGRGGVPVFIDRLISHSLRKQGEGTAETMALRKYRRFWAAKWEYGGNCADMHRARRQQARRAVYAS